MRAMVLEFNDDTACKYLDQQYMLGESLLVAPIFNSEGEVSYWVPQGIWTDFFTGERIEGGIWRTEKHGYLSVPLLARPNSIIAMGNDDTKPDYNYADDVVFHVFEIGDGMCAVSEVADTSGEKAFHICVKREGCKIFVETDGSCMRWSVYLRGIANVESVLGGNCISDELGAKIIPDESGKVEVMLR